ncbi:MAG: response regulator [Rhodoferax sp.]|nr:response regulator [Rhodoferax sp.]MCF8210278.1 response regulator [Rhodoferax sp.]
MADRQTSQRPTVLIVDDQPENLSVLGELLESDYTVRVAASGRRAIKAAASLPYPDLILLDVMMPEIDGHEVLRQLRANPITEAIPVVFVTAMDESHDEELGFKLGAVDYITKPIKPVIVLARVQTQIQLKQAQDKLRLHNADLETEIRRRMRDNRIVEDVAMRALASLAETRDNETGNHIRRTQGYVDLLARKLAERTPQSAALSLDAIEMLVKAAPLHDIGKVGIPDHILNKPGPLNSDEWTVMKRHTIIGARSIEHAMDGEADHSPLAFLHVAMEISHSHHEKWDGTGYPAGLRGEAIPLSARLMALADVFDALISRRVYKPAFSHERARSIIAEGRGSHFEPALVDIFLARFDDFQAIALRYSDDDRQD